MAQGLEAQGPVTRSPLSLHLHAPRTGALSTQVPTGGQAGESAAGPCGSRHTGRGRPLGGQGGGPSPLTGPPLLRQHTESSAKRSIWLRSGCLVCKGSLGPPTYPRPHYCKRRPSLKGTPITQTSSKVMLRMVSSKGGESKQRGRP